ncbi:hypothetical protein NC652_013615 [Populus alba x Populus x berolinensis]|nr:hypothetical protein NC652_013615 [Populus alba x Populus x berolinensis]
MKEGWARSWVRAGLLNRRKQQQQKQQESAKLLRNSCLPTLKVSLHSFLSIVLNFVYFYLVGSRYCKETNSLISDSIGIQLSNPRIILH